MTPTVLYQKQTSQGSFAQDPRVGDLQVQRFFPDSRRDRFVQAALTIEGKLGNFDVTYAGAYLDRKAYQANDYTDYSEAYDALYANYTDPDTGDFVCSGLAGCFYLQDTAETQSTHANISSAPTISGS